MANVDQTGLNDSHKRRIAAVLTSVEELLEQIEAAAAAGESKSPFSSTHQDLTPTQQQVVRDYVARLRSVLTSTVPLLGSHGGRRSTAASWAIQTNLRFVAIAAEELGPSFLRGYGAVEERGAAALERLQDQLRTLVRQIETYLEQDLGRDPAARLARLQRAPVDLEVLRNLERIITQRGLVELRPLLEALIEQLETHAVEVAVFGRVSSGKSSLLNELLGEPVLPICVTPVTTVPTRIVWSEQRGAHVSFAEGADAEVALDRLAEFVSEEANPANAKRVRRVVAHGPFDRLRHGVVFVDTPGVGSLATSGACETYGYLPRCDLGILLIDATSGPAREDLEILRLLYDSGIPGLAVLSKADLLAAPDRERMRAYVETQIRGMLALDLQVHPVSSIGATATLAERWFDHEVAPQLASARAVSEASSRRKFNQLRSAVAALLETQQGTPRDAEALRRAEADAATVIRDVSRRARDLTFHTEEALQLVVGRAARELLAHPGAAPAEVVQRIVVKIEEELLSTIHDLVSRSRDRLRLLLEGLGGRGDDLQLDLLNLPAIGADIPEFVIARSRVPLRGMAEKKIRASIEERCDRAVRAALSPFLGALRTWVERQTVWLERQFVLHARSASMAREKGVPPGETVTADLDAIRAAANAKPTAERAR